MMQKETSGIGTEPTPVLSLLKIDAFGGFSKKSLGPFKPGLNVVFGKNEAGKSTATNFITQMLYGWERANSKSSTHYRPNGKGSRSGSLFFDAGPHGEWEIVRKEPGNDVGVVTHKGPLSENLAEQLISSVDKQTFLNVFSFNAEQLQTLEGGDSVTSKLLTASSATAISPVDALEKIQTQMKLYTGKVTSEGANKSLYSLPLKRKEIEVLENELAQYKEAERENFATYLQLSQLEKKRDELRRAKTSDSNRQKSAHEARAAADIYNRIQEQSRELSDDRESYEKAAADASAITANEAVLRLGEEITFLASSSEIYKATYAKKKKLEGEVLLLKAKQTTLRDSGCASDASVQEYLQEARAQKAELEIRKQTTKEQLDEAIGEQAGIQAKIDTVIAQNLQPVQKQSNLNKIFIFLALPFFVAGVVLAIMGMGLFGAAAVVVGALLVLAGVLLPTKTSNNEAPQSAAQSDFSADLQNANERVAKTQTKYDQSCFQLNSFLQETQMMLVAKGFVGEFSGSPLFQTSETAISLEEASKIPEQQLEYNAVQSKIVALEAQAIQEKQTFNAWKARVVAVLDALNIFKGLVGDEDLFVAIEKARLQHEEEFQNLQAHNKAQLAVATLRDQISRAEARLASTVEEFWSLAGRASDVEEIVAAVARKKQEESDALQAFSNVQEGLREANQQIGDLKVSLGKVENDTGMQSTQMELAEAQAQIRVWTKEYLELVVAQKLLTETISQWGNTKQPQIYQEASDLFRELTLGAWTEVRPGNKEGLVVAVSADREVRDSSQLSTSTSQLLYLSLRLALLKANPNIGRSLPLVMDDAFVNMDERRSLAVAKVISDVAAMRQVIVFTFKDETKELFLNCCKDVNIVTF